MDDYWVDGRLFAILVSRSGKGRESRFFPEITTKSIPGAPTFFKRRNASRIIRLARFRITALPTFFDAMMPSRFLSKPLLRKKRVNVVSALFLCPRFITPSNWERFNNLSFLWNDWFSINHRASRFRPLRLRLARTLRPPTVAFRARNPWVRFLLKFLGWYVLFMISFL